jgi:transcriptional regulator with XRE-family HTH domain
MDDLTSISIDPAKFKQAREEKGLTQDALASAVGVQKAAISKFENGHGKPSADVLLRLCLTLDIKDIAELVA